MSPWQQYSRCHFVSFVIYITGAKFKLLSIEHIVTTSYHPRLNGSTERVHRWLNAAVGIYCEKHQERWEEFLQPAVYAHNVSPIPGTGQISPFFLVFGRNAPSPEVITLDVPVETLMQTIINEYRKYHDI